jgi:arylsulfatase A-like enzyme
MAGMLLSTTGARTVAALAAAVAIAAAVVWLTRPTASRLAVSANRASTAATPVIVYLIDTLRADRLGLYGYSRRPTSPQIDALAADSVVFDQAYAAAPWTLPSVASLVTSTFACEHGVVTYGRKLNAALSTLAEQLAQMGYLSAAYFSNVHAGAIADLSRGHRIVEERPTTANDRAADTEAFLRTQSRGRFFLYLHTMEPHEPFHTPAGVISRFGHVSIEDRETYRAMWLRLNELRSADWAAGRAPGTTDNSAEQRQILRYLDDHRDGYELLYDAAVAHADEHLGQTVEVLKRSGLWDRALFVLIADHGEEFGEHGGWLHGQAVYDEQLRVPLIVHLPSGEFAGRRIRQPVSLVDVMPTILEYLGRSDLCAQCRGTSLLPLLRDQPAAASDRESGFVPALRMNELHYYGPAHEQRGEINVALRRGLWKGIWNAGPGSLELYDLAADPRETTDAVTNNGGVAAEMRRQANRWLDECRRNARPSEGSGGVDAQTREKLRALGYIR